MRNSPARAVFGPHHAASAWIFCAPLPKRQSRVARLRSTRTRNIRGESSPLGFESGNRVDVAYLDDRFEGDTWDFDRDDLLEPLIGSYNLGHVVHVRDSDACPVCVGLMLGHLMPVTVMSLWGSPKAGLPPSGAAALSITGDAPSSYRGAKGCDVRLPIRVSQLTTRFDSGARYILVDEGSANGTFSVA